MLAWGLPQLSTGRLYYTPNTWLSGSLLLVFIVRMAYVLLRAWGDAQAPSPPGHWHSTLITLCIFGTLAGYNMAYHAGLLRWRQQVLAQRLAKAESTHHR